MKTFEEEIEYENEVARIVYRVTPIIWLTEVEPGHRRKGLGSKLLRKTLSKLKSEGYQFVYTFLNPDDKRAVEFYRHSGFEKKWGEKEVYQCELSDEWIHDEAHKQRWG